VTEQFLLSSVHIFEVAIDECRFLPQAAQYGAIVKTWYTTTI
jgi:hypothetical protein